MPTVPAPLLSFLLLLLVIMSAFASKIPHKFRWQQTMLRIKDPARSVRFYEDNFAFKLLHKYDFPEWKFSLYFMGILPSGAGPPAAPGSKAAEDFLWGDHSGVTLELTHNWGTEEDDSFKINNGNVEPFRGFGHIAVYCNDVYKCCEQLENNGVSFQKRPDEGRMKGLAFALDPDGYWIEVIRRNDASSIRETGPEYTLSQTMIRVKDPVKSLRFYRDLLGMTLLEEKHFSDFSLYFLANVKEGSDRSSMFEPVIELTHNHGTESNESFSYHNGNDEDIPNGKLRGFGHVGFLTDDLDGACAALETEGVVFKKRPTEGNMRGLAFVYDPDGYSVEIIKTNGLSLVK